MLNALVLVSLIIFYLLFIGRAIILYRRGIKVWVIGTSSKNIFEAALEKVFFPFLLLWSVFVVLNALDTHIFCFMLKRLTQLWFLQYMGIIFCYTGLTIFLCALISFGNAWRIGIDLENSNKLITSGIFKRSRNPIFLFIDLYFTAIALIYPTIIFIIAALLTIAAIHIQILREEVFLAKKFGKKYINYKNRVRRYL